MSKLSQASSKLGARHQRDYSPVSWLEYFDEAHDITPADWREEPNDPIVIRKDTPRTSSQETIAPQDSFRVYLRNFHEPFAPQRKFGQKLDPRRVELSEAEFSQLSNVPTLVALHGGGYSALSWAQFVRHIEQHCECRILAIDLRGHGDTKTSNDDQMDIDTLVGDVINVTKAAHRICGFPECPKLVLLGHSMGGAIAVKCAAKCNESLATLAGFVIIDVVEGTAKDALPLMLSVIKTRPSRFPTLSNAIEWSVRSGLAKNSDAARVSMPGSLINLSDGRLAVHDVPFTTQNESKTDDHHHQDDGTQQESQPKSHSIDNIKQNKFSISLDQLIGHGPPAALSPRLPLPARVRALGGRSNLPSGVPTCAQPVICENDESYSSGEQENNKQAGKKDLNADDDDNGGYKRPPEVRDFGYGWRTNLAKTQPFWDGWFDGLSAELLAAPVDGKFLLLAGIDRLDKTLTIAHMQGKFMMKVLPKCGHAVHEDVPDKVALAIGDFLVRNKFTKAI